MEQACRVCMSNSVTLVDIFTKPPVMKREPSLADMLNSFICAWKVKPDDPLPKKICLTCVIEAKNAFKFKAKCERSQKLFWEMLAEEKAISEMFQEETSTPNTDIDLGCVKIEKEDSPAEQHNNYISIIDTKTKEPTTKKRESSNLVQGSEIIAKGFSIRSLSPALTLVNSPNYCLFKCQHCSKIFKERPQLQAHLRVHKGDEPRIFQCPHCTESFKKFENLHLHLRSHSVQRPFVCRHCSKSFHYLSTLERHLQTHDPLHCPHCPKVFARKQDLSYHILVHTGERPYKCPHCSKAFKKKQHVEYHLLTHKDKGQGIMMI